MKTITSFNIVYTVYDDKTKTYSEVNLDEDFMKKAKLYFFLYIKRNIYKHINRF